MTHYINIQANSRSNRESFLDGVESKKCVHVQLTASRVNYYTFFLLYHLYTIEQLPRIIRYGGISVSFNCNIILDTIETVVIKINPPNIEKRSIRSHYDPANSKNIRYDCHLEN